MGFTVVNDIILIALQISFQRSSLKKKSNYDNCGKYLSKNNQDSVCTNYSNDTKHSFHHVSPYRTYPLKFAEDPDSPKNISTVCKRGKRTTCFDYTDTVPGEDNQSPWIPSIEAQVIVVFVVQYLLWVILEAWWIFDHHNDDSKENRVLFNFVLCFYRSWMVSLTFISYADYMYWREEYPGKKFRRSDPRCISYKQPPLLTGDDLCWNRYPESLISSLKLTNASCLVKQSDPREKFHENLKKTGLQKSKIASKSTGEKMGCSTNVIKQCSTTERAETPGNMDHLFMTFIEYLYVTWLLRPSAYILMFFGGKNSGGIFGILWLKFKEWIQVTKLSAKKESETVEAKLVSFILESLSIMISNVHECHNTGTLLGELHIDNISHIDCGTDTFRPGHFLIKMDIGSRRVVSASFSGKTISNKDALCLCFNAWAGLVHPVIHSYANWGCLLSSSEGYDNMDRPISQFLRKMSLITAKYNNFGSDGFRVAMAFLKMIGVNKYIGNDFGLLSTCHGEHNVPSHKDIFKLKRHSRFVNFIHNTRGIFLQEFFRFQRDFPGVNGEAFFLGTVYHSVDHYSAATQLKISDLQHDSIEYAADCELSRVILNSFVDKPPIRFFECRFSHAPHPFFKAVYNHAKMIDEDFADAMECCIAV